MRRMTPFGAVQNCDSRLFRWGGMKSDVEFAVVGAGPYGLSVANHLRARGAEVRVFGKRMEFWSRQMPDGMLLRSPLAASHISDARGQLTLDDYEQAIGRTLKKRLPIDDFIRYGIWFQQRSVSDLENRSIASMQTEGRGYRVMLDDGESLHARKVVIAAGIAAFAMRPMVFDSLPSELVSHASDPCNKDFGRFSGKSVAVVGAGQSATEFAALMNERGAEVEMLVRKPHHRWLIPSKFKFVPGLNWLIESKLNPLHAPGKIGPFGLSWLIEHPSLFTKLSRRRQEAYACLAIRPAASHWLAPRMQGVKITTDCEVERVATRGMRIHLHLNYGAERVVDHVLLCTGYRVDIAQYTFLSGELQNRIKSVLGYPLLNSHFESVSCPGVYFLGATAAYSWGPYFRFVAGTGYAAAAVSRHAQK